MTEPLTAKQETDRRTRFGDGEALALVKMYRALLIAEARLECRQLELQQMTILRDYDRLAKCADEAEAVAKPARAAANERFGDALAVKEAENVVWETVWALEAEAGAK